MTTKEFKKITVADGSKSFSFKGVKLGSARHFHNKQLSVWDDYTVYKRSSGFVCTITEEAYTSSSVASNHRLHKPKNKKEIVALLGMNKGAQELYCKIGITNPQALLNK